MASTLLATKLHRPRPTSTLVARPRLNQRVDEVLQDGHRPILALAPASYGKTTLNLPSDKMHHPSRTVMPITSW